MVISADGRLSTRRRQSRASAIEQFNVIRVWTNIVVLTKTRWQLRRVVRTLSQTFTALKVGQQPDKTCIGRIERGFNLRGYCFCRGPVTAQRTLQNHATRIHRLYEQQKTAPDGAARLDEYVARWRRWCGAGLWMLDRSGLQYPGSFASETETGKTEA
jgi:hypothetical protein